MIVDYKSINLFEKTLFTWVKIKPPVNFAAPMPETEACFTYMLEGETWQFSEREAIKTRPRDAILSKCGKYVSKMLVSNDSEMISSVTVHFHSDVLKKVYADSVPKFLKEHNLLKNK